MQFSFHSASAWALVQLGDLALRLSDDPLYRARRLLTKAHERLDQRGETMLAGLLNAGDPHGEVRMAWHAKEVVRSIYDITDADLAIEFVTQLAQDLQATIGS